MNTLTNTTRRIKLYEQLYGLPTIAQTEEVDSSFFSQCQPIRAFVVLVIVNNIDRYFFHRDFTRHSSCELLRTDVRLGETPERAAIRLLEETSIVPVELLPLAVLVNTFTCGQQETQRFGLAFLARTIHNPTAVGNDSPTFTSYTPRRLNSMDRQLLVLAQEHLQQQKLDAPEEEVTASLLFFARLWFHRRFVKPLFRASSYRIRERVFFYLKEKKVRTAIDVAAGDDTLILEIANLLNLELCVVNDISYKTLSLLQRVEYPNVIFTNHNAVSLPYKVIFDLALCKNTLHHMRSEGEMYGLLSSLRRVAKRILLIDIEDPHRSTGLARLWRAYYARFLGDQGSSFLSKGEFNHLISTFYQNAYIRFDEVNTLRGRFLFAVVDLEDKPL